jgi:phospholipase C
MDEFFKDAAQGTLPSYSFIEPRLVVNHNDQHPPVDDFLYTHAELAGEELIYQVYQAIRHSPNWERTLFILTYDEHGGCYDHVPPPRAVPPDPHAPAGQYDFKFDRLGVRLPTILVSPYVEPGAVLHTTFDHTSIIKTACERWNLAPLTERDRAANDLSDALTLDTPRDDVPEIQAQPYQRVPRPEDEPLNGFQKGVLAVVAGMSVYYNVDQRKPLTARVADVAHLVENELEIHKLKTIGEAWHFMKAKLDFTFQYEGVPGEDPAKH